MTHILKTGSPGGVAHIHSGIQDFRNSGIQKFRNSGILEFRNSGIQEFRNAGVQEDGFINRLHVFTFSSHANTTPLVRVVVAIVRKRLIRQNETYTKNHTQTKLKT